ncbi:ead/Ea22-like family protein [Klebsiella michiganensis]|uniref:ead/Ea22-like family protein n=1 Tax=Klebsiella michiganensis TaxID=1134687 RepID=UPI00301A58E1
MTDITELAQSLKAAAEKATPGQWMRSSVQFNSITNIANPMEQGNKPHVANTSEKRDAEFIALANPANILALVEALEKAQKSNEFLKGQLSELANFNPDWDKLEASYESWREIAAELLVAKEHIAELEDAEQKLCAANETLDARAELAERQLAEMGSRTVKLPENIVDKVCLTAAEIHAQGSGVSDDKAQDIIDRIREILTPDAGIKWEAE